MRFARDGPYVANLTKPPADLTRISARNGGSFPEVKMRRYIEGADQVAAHAPATCPSGGVSCGSRPGQGADPHQRPHGIREVAADEVSLRGASAPGGSESSAEPGLVRAAGV